MIKLAIIDDHPIVLAGLHQLLEGHPKVVITGAFGDYQQLLEFLPGSEIDVLLFDLQLPGVDPVQLLKTIKSIKPSLKVLVLTNMDQVFTARTMLVAGVDGYVLKGIDQSTLVEAIVTVSEGIQYIDVSLRDEICNIFLGTDDGLPLLTEREQKILELISQELTTRQIATQLHLSTKRIETLRTDLFQKLHVKNSAGLVRKGITLGLIPAQ
ncbi:response regulator [Chitinophaga sp. RCC_12]|uniref:response regulator n=1 Tax=Chitinophaga sp. RCC_12 TaxID=3239226 RepID=UPI0035261033